MKSYVVTLEYMFGSIGGLLNRCVCSDCASSAIKIVMDELKSEKIGVYSINLLNVERV